MSKKLWTEEERFEFLAWIALNFEAGVVVRGTNRAVRKARYKYGGQGKSGGLRVYYFVVNADDVIEMLAVHKKSDIESLSAAVLNELLEKNAS